VFSKLPPEDQEDLFSEVVQELQKDGFRLLRMYRNQGRPFAVWFWLALRRRALDYHRAAKKRGHSDVPPWLPENGPYPDGIVENREALRDLERIMEGLSERCQVLLLAAAQGYKPKELVGLLGLPVDHNKKLADHLKNCRRSLVKALARHGYTVDDVL
jgi:DNA-directed RNA polymerase specialized sigma24 family protein